MKNLKKITAIITAFAAMFSVTSCGKKEDASSGGEKITLKYVMAGPGIQADSQKVWKTFNEKLQEKLPNVEVEFEVFPMADYKQQFMLMQTGREKMDIVNTYGLNFADEVRKKTFKPLDELLNTHGAEVKEALPEWLWDYGKVNGEMYAVPSYQMMAVQYAFKTHKELADKYLDKERLEKALYSSEHITGEVWVVLEEYLAKLKENGELRLGANHWLNDKGTETITGRFSIKVDDPECKVSYDFMSEKMKEYYALMADWYQKGYIRPDSLSATDVDEKKGKEDGYTLWTDFDNYGGAEVDKIKYGFEVYSIPVSDKYYIPYTNAAAGTAIMNTCENAEAAMQVINLLQTDKELYNLLVWGVEGDHYTVMEDGRIQTEYDGQATSNARYGLFKWIIGNTSLSYETQSDLPGTNDHTFNVVNKSDFRSKLIGFIPDTTNIATQIAQLDSIKGEYMGSLQSGALENWEEVYNEWVGKMEKAKYKEVEAELQKQVDEFLAAKGK